jgi:hypothetical protein
MIRSMSYSRNFRIPNPRLTGSASVPSRAATCTTFHKPVGLSSHTSTTPETMKTVAPLSSHLS